MAYARRSRTTARRAPSRSYRAAPRSRSRARAPSRSRGRASGRGAGQTVRLVIEQAPASVVARPSYLSKLNPAVVEAARTKKAKL